MLCSLRDRTPRRRCRSEHAIVKAAGGDMRQSTDTGWDFVVPWDAIIIQFWATLHAN